MLNTSYSGSEKSSKNPFEQLKLVSYNLFVLERLQSEAINALPSEMMALLKYPQFERQMLDNMFAW